MGCCELGLWRAGLEDAELWAACWAHGLAGLMGSGLTAANLRGLLMAHCWAELHCSELRRGREAASDVGGSGSESQHGWGNVSLVDRAWRSSDVAAVEELGGGVDFFERCCWQFGGAGAARWSSVDAGQSAKSTLVEGRCFVDRPRCRRSQVAAWRGNRS